MKWEVLAAIVAVVLGIIDVIFIFIKTGKILQIIETLCERVDKNEQKSIDSDKDIKKDLEELIEKLSTEVRDNKVDFDAFRWDVTTNLLVALKDNMSALVDKEIEKLKEEKDQDLEYLTENTNDKISVVSDNLEETKEDLEKKIDKLEEKIISIEHDSIIPIKEKLAALKEQLRDK